MDEEYIIKQILDSCYSVYNELGAGLLESIYEKAIMCELNLRGLMVKSQVEVFPKYKDFELGVGYRLDLLVENSIIIEIKSVDEMKPVFSKQLLTYLKICNLRYGILVNFNTDFLKTSIKRIVNGY